VAAHLNISLKDRIREAFQHAVSAAGGLTERSYRIAGHGIVVHAAGAAAMEAFHRAVRHLELEEPDPASLEVLTWDGQDGGVFPAEPVGAPVGPWTRPPWHLQFVPMDEAHFQPPWRRISGLIDADTAVHWAPDLMQMSIFDQGTPLVTGFDRWLTSFGIHVVHAGAVASKGGAALIVGDNGAGKSSTSIACAESGLDYLGDDYVAVELDPPRVHSLYCSARLSWDHPAGIGSTLPLSTTREDNPDKALLFLGDRAVDTRPIKAIIAPRVGNGTATTLKPLRAGAALAALAPSSVLQLAANGATRLGHARRLCSEVPAFELQLGTDASSIGALVEEAIGS
jgi:hypothetical protein